MKLHTKILAILLLANLICFSQETLLITEITGNDTVYTVSETDIETHNHAFADLKSCNDLADSIYSELQTSQELNQVNELIIENYKQSEINLQSQLKEKGVSNDLLNSENKGSHKAIKWLKLQRNVLACALTASVAYIGIKSAFD